MNSFFKNKHSITAENPDYNREIRVFVSSTFSDLQEERNALVRTFNYLKKEAEKRDVHIIMIDLRWGITESEAAQGKVIDICLKEIIKSRPFFIGIIGDNYGTVPPISLSTDIEILNDYPDVAIDIKNGKSYTEIEMQYGVLGNPDTLDAFFYIKNKHGETKCENNEKLLNLKQRIKEQDRYPVYDYSTAEEVAEQVRIDFLKILEERFPDREITTEDKKKQKHLGIYSSLIDFYVERPALQDQLYAFIDSSSASNKLIHITSPTGYGKSALCAKIIQLFSSKPDYDILYYFAEQGEYKEDVSDIASLFLNKTLGYQEAEVAIMQAIENNSHKKILVLDGLDSFDIESITQYGFSWLSLLPPNYTIIITTTTGTRLDCILSSQNIPSRVSIEPLSSKEKKQFTIDYLQKIGKKLEPNQQDRISKSPLTGNPAILRCLLDELSVYGIFEKLDDRISYYTSRQTSNDFYESVLYRLEEDFGVELVRSILQPVAIARVGLTEDEILELCNIKRIELSLLLSNCPSFITVTDSFVHITNNQMRSIIIKRTIEDGKLDEVRNKIVDYFYDNCKSYSISLFQYNPQKDFLLYDGISRNIHEVAHQLYELKDYKSLFNCLVNPSFFEVLFRTDQTFLSTAWKALESAGFSFESILEEKALELLDYSIAPVIFNDLGRFAMNAMDNYQLSKRFYQLCSKRITPIVSDSTKKKVETVRITNLAIASYKSGHYEEALSLFEKCLALTREIPDFGPNSEELAIRYANLARIHKVLKHYDEAIKYFNEALKIYQQKHKGFHEDIADILDAMAFCHYKKDEDTIAICLYRQAYDAYSALKGRNSEDAITAQFGIGRSMVYSGDYSNAVEVLNETLDNSIRVLGEDDDTTHDIYGILGYCWERIYTILCKKVSKDECKQFIENSAICYAHAKQDKDAQRVLDIYNSL